MPKYEESWESNKSRPGDKKAGLLAVFNLLRGTRGSLMVIGGLLLLCAFYLTCTTYIGPGEFGVKQVLYSPFGLFGPMGTQNKIYETGIHHQFPTVERILRFPRTIQVLTMRDNPDAREKITETISSTDEKFTRIVKAAYIQTSDGFYVKMDTSILYCIEDPVKLVNRVGAGKLYEDNGILPVAENAIKVRLGTLQPEDFFDAKIRVAKLDEARDLMNEKLQPMGLKVKHVLARYPHLHPDVASRVEENNLQKQTKLLNVSLTAQSAAEAELAKAVNEGTAAKGVALQKGKAYQVQRESEKELYERTKKAEGDKIRKMAEARKAELLNEAYRGAGSDMMVGMKMAGNLTNLETILVPAGGPNAFNPLDVQSLMRLFSIGSTNQPTAP
ncbi:MAG: SPFH domain-containing protein [Verrucomicrobia bacterium]|nr:SPFH domain-containing protein [Verrucomicrobiota bacterium]